MIVEHSFKEIENCSGKVTLEGVVSGGMIYSPQEIQFNLIPHQSDNSGIMGYARIKYYKATETTFAKELLDAKRKRLIVKVSGDYNKSGLENCAGEIKAESVEISKD